MSQVVLDAIAASVAALTPVADAAVEPLGYGTDLSCVDDLTPTMDEVSGTPLLAEAILRRFTTPRGTLPDIAGTDLRDKSYGLDLSEYLNRGLTQQEILAIAAQTRSEAKKDPRIASVRSTVIPSPTGNEFSVDMQVTPADGSGPFALVLAVTSAGVLIAELRGVR